MVIYLILSEVGCKFYAIILSMFLACVWSNFVVKPYGSAMLSKFVFLKNQPKPGMGISCLVRQTETRKTHFSYRGRKNEILERSEAERGRFFSEIWNMSFSCRGINVQGANIALSSREKAKTAKRSVMSMAPWGFRDHAHQARKTRYFIKCLTRNRFHEPFRKLLSFVVFWLLPPFAYLCLLRKTAKIIILVGTCALFCIF